MIRRAGWFAGGMTLWMLWIPAVHGAEDKKFGFEIEGAPAWQTRNDVRIPNNTGTKFSLRDLQGSGPTAVARITIDYRFLPKHELRLLAAPFSVTGTGRLSAPTSFAGTSFAPGQDVLGRYEFNSYRLTYRYRIYEGSRWTWKLGATGKIRDAKIELRQGAVTAVDDNVGFVPLVHLDGEYRFSPKWRMNLNMDGLAAKQGRAFDISLKMKYDLSKNVTLGFGYRTLEGGADVEDVYTFAWVHYATASIAFRF
jgi:hypothetical protein